MEKLKCCDDISETYDQLSKEIIALSNEGYEIGSITISYYDDITNEEFRSLCESEKLKIICGDN